MDTAKRAVSSKATSLARNKTARSREETDADVLDDQMKSPGNNCMRHTRHSDAQQQTGSKRTAAKGKLGRKATDQHLQQQHQQDVIMIDVTESEQRSESGTESEEAPVQHRGRSGRSSPPATAHDSEVSSEEADEEQEAASGSEQDHSGIGEGLEAAEPATSSESDEDGSDENHSSTSHDASDGGSSSSRSGSESEPFQSTATRTRRRSRAAAAAQLTVCGKSTTPSRRGRPPNSNTEGTTAAAAAGTPRGTRKATTSTAATASTPRSARQAAAPAATPRSTRAPAAAAATTPSGRSVRSCTTTPKAQQQPSLATPLAKLSIKSAATPKPPQSTGRRLRSAAAAAPSSSKQRRRSKTSSCSHDGTAVGDLLEAVVVDGEVFQPGDDVYLALDGFDHEEDEDEACEVCGSSNCRRGNAMLECSTCLRGFHLRCLSPPLRAVPEGDWLCTECNAGRVPPPPSKLVTRWQKLLYGQDQLVLVHIMACQRGKDPDGREEDQVLVKYYLLPQDTHVGRQKEHNARELFLGSQIYPEPAQAVLCRAYVHHSSDFADAQQEEGNDVYLCDFEYEEDWRRFRARRYGRDGRAISSTLGAGACPATPGERLSGAWGGAQRRGLGADFFDDELGREADSDLDIGSNCDSEEGEEDYRPDFGQQLHGARTALKRKRHGKLPAAALVAAAANRFAGLGTTDIGRQRVRQQDAFAALHASLSLAAVPASLPCRQEERTRLDAFLSRALREDGGILYICGVPGTGKTALVMEVLGSLEGEAHQAGAQLVAINCLQLPSPQHVFSRLWEKLSGQHLGPARARDALMQLFGVAAGSSSRRRYSTIIVLDEIDMLMTKDQAVLYQLFDWPSQPGSRLAVIGISNTHDLDQRVLPRIASRLDQAKLAFGPYSHAQLMTIAQDRLKDSGAGGAVEEQAVQWACRKVAAETGDVRRALEMLRRAVEIARQQHLADLVANGKPGVAAAAAGGGGASSSRHHQQQQQQQALEVQWKEGDAALVLRGHVRQAQAEMFSALHLQLLRSRSCWEKVMLVSMVVEARATSKSAVVIQNVCQRAANSIASLVDLTPPSLGVLQHCLVKLAGVRLLLSDGTHIKAHVALNVDKDDVALAIKEDSRLQRLHQLL